VWVESWVRQSGISRSHGSRADAQGAL